MKLVGAADVAGAAEVARPSVLVVGSGWRFTSGISYYTCRLANTFAERGPTRALLMRRLVPRILYPGKARVGERVNDLDYVGSVDVYDGVDWYWGTSMRGACRFVRRNPPDVVVLQWWTGAVLHSYLRLARTARALGSRVVIEWHEVQDTGEARIPGVTNYVRRAMQMLLKLVDGHVVHSAYDLDLLRRAYGLSTENVAVAPHGPYDHHLSEDPSNLAPVPMDLKGSPDDFTFLYFGTIRPYKGVEDAVAAFDRLPDRVRTRSRLLVVGESWEGWTAPLEAIAASPNADRITLVNRYVSDAEVSAYFAAADAVVLPYRRSSASGPLHIAMSAGLPVLVTEVGGLVEAAGDYAGTRFVPPAAPAALADAMTEVVSWRGRRFEDPHSWDATMGAYDGLFEQLGVLEPAAVPSVDGLLDPDYLIA